MTTSDRHRTLAVPSWPTMAAIATVCTLLSACGIPHVVQEANDYRAEQTGAVAIEIKGCRAGDGRYTRWDHRRGGSDTPDCYLAMVDAAAIAVPGHAQPTDHQADAGAAEHPRVAGPAPMKPTELPTVRSGGELVDQVAFMAMLANLSYHRFLPNSGRGDPKEACTVGLDSYDPLNTLRGTTGDDAGAGGWQRWEQSGIGCRSAGGLFYETYVYRSKPTSTSKDPRGDVAMAVIAFRGTENYWGQAQIDWPTNAANAFHILPSEYAEVQRSLPALLTKLLDGRRFPVYVTGHSLGGGLAQFAAYLRSDITAAYTFNTSPATGWTILREQLKSKPADLALMQQQDPNIIRVKQEGEWLGILRTVSDAANATIRRSNRTDVLFDFPVTREVIQTTGRQGWTRKVVELHSIQMLACNLAARVAAGGETAAFGFTKAMAQRAIDETTRPRKSGSAGAAPEFAEQGLCQIDGKSDDGSQDLHCAVDWLGRTPVSCTAAAPGIR